jgi:hypothetical protein
MKAKVKHTAFLAAVILAAGMMGCSQQAIKVTGAEEKLPDKEGSPGFLDRLSSQTSVSENDAYRGVLMLVDGEDTAETFRQRAEKLVATGTAARAWTHDANRPITRGRLAFMVCKICKIRGGVVMHVTGPTQRYCLRELQYMSMISSGGPLSPVTGLEYVAVMTRADIYRRTGELPAIMEVTQ